ncbi:MAG: DUF2309 domain-containing protein [Devosiaceae bacterium]|nr:DUF2309 domain-containing protein [Devosiaceae bacterium MH13]
MPVELTVPASSSGNGTWRRTKRALDAARQAVKAIPPVWPLASSVAVNPYLGQAHLSLAQTGALLGKVAGLPVTMPRAWYAGRIAEGAISDAHLQEALDANTDEGAPGSVDALKAALRSPEPAREALPTAAELAADATGTDWPALIADRIGAWAAGYFDEGQALWAAPKGRGAYAAWRDVATHDLTPEIAGLTGFARYVADAPQTAEDALARSLARLGLSDAMLPTYFHSLLASLGGWSQVARYRLWKADLAEDDDRTATDFLAIRLIWEEALLQLAGDSAAERFEAVKAAHAAVAAPDADLVTDSILQEAAERAAQADLAATLAAPAPSVQDSRPLLQAAFCIDVRSEVFRRSLEALDGQIETLGFAGFFGITPSHKAFGSDVDELRLPVLINPALKSVSGTVADGPAAQQNRFLKRTKRAWGRFKLAAVSSFAFVEATGPLYAYKLVRDALNMGAKAEKADPKPRLDPSLSVEQMVDAANTVLRAMSLTENFARIVLLAGHGASVTNNPHKSALHCGACGGYSGEVNARLLASVLNHSEVRAGLIEKGITIPDDTLFLGGLHDTTADRLALFEDDQPIGSHGEDLAMVKRWLADAGAATRLERAKRLPRAERADALFQRTIDWAETRPEWALAGCKAFIAAPRARTTGRDLSGSAFLHDYVWRKDEGFGVLELIMTAPVVVASWISLQYYGSTVSPQAFGGGNKLLHNVVGGIGVVEGNGGLLRPGLPWQSVHDGEGLVHDPLRLSVCIEAPTEAMTAILEKHPDVRALFDNRWLHLFALDDTGQMAWRYDGDLTWQPMPRPEAPVSEAA